MQTPADKGWGSPASLDYANMVRWQIWPGHTVSVRNPDVGVVFAELIRLLRGAGWKGPDAQLDEWGYAKRLKRWAQSAGQNLASAPMGSWSDHSWGTAIDLDTAVNPMYARRPGNAQAHTSMPMRACPRIAAALGLEWGGSWDEPWDPQHWQVAVSPARLRAIADSIRTLGVGQMHAAPAPAPKPAKPPTPPEDDVSYEDAAKAVRDVLNLPLAGLGVPLGQHDNGALAVLLVGMGQGEINRDKATLARDAAEAVQMQAIIAAVDPDALAAQIAAKLKAAVPAMHTADDTILIKATGEALREVFVKATQAATPAATPA